MHLASLVVCPAQTRLCGRLVGAALVLLTVGLWCGGVEGAWRADIGW